MSYRYQYCTIAFMGKKGEKDVGGEAPAAEWSCWKRRRVADAETASTGGSDAENT